MGDKEGPSETESNENGKQQRDLSSISQACEVLINGQEGKCSCSFNFGNAGLNHNNIMSSLQDFREPLLS